jgi:hypothetical protein
MSKDFPKSFKPKAREGITLTKQCDDCPLDPFHFFLCPGTQLSKETFLIGQQSQPHPAYEIQQNVLYMETQHEETAQALGCLDKKPFINGQKEFSDMMKTKFAPNGKER